MARVKLDEDLSPLVAEPLIRKGHQVLTVASQGWSGTPDVLLWQRLKDEQVLFITADKGFGDLRTYPPGTHHGIVLLRPDHESLPQFASLLENLVNRHSLESLSGNLTVVTSRRIRIRRR
jgi:predicted nuclease of predicted toxin-antitoxin system